jgi:hypothetical protein
VFQDESTRVLVRAALELALQEKKRVQIALRPEAGMTERPKRLGFVSAITADARGYVTVMLRDESGNMVELSLENIYGVRRM